MELRLDVTTNQNCSLRLQDYSDYIKEYNLTYPIMKFRWEDTGSIAIVIFRKSSGDDIRPPVFMEHGCNDYFDIPVRQDGWFIIHYLVLPTKEFVSLPIFNESMFENGVYCIDKTKIYKKVNGEFEESSVEEITQINTSGTTISKTYCSYFSIYFLNQCYVSIVKQILKSGFNPCGKRSTTEDDLIYRRDLLWMTLNVIKYIVSGTPNHCSMPDLDTSLAEAQRILEKVSGCNGLCKTEFTNNPNHDCGCK